MKISESGTFIDLSEALNQDKNKKNDNDNSNKKYSFFFKIKLLFNKYVYLFKSRFKDVDESYYDYNKYQV